MSLHTEVERASIAEITPPKTNISSYVGEIIKIAYEFQDVKTSWGIEAYSQEDFHEGSPKHRLISFLAAHGFWTEIHLNDEVLEDVLWHGAENSKVGKTLSKIGHQRTIFNLNADCARVFKSMSPFQLQFYLTQQNFSMANKKNHTTVMLFNDSTKEMVNSALQYYIDEADSIRKNPYDLGLMFCPEKPVEDTYKGFKSPEKYGSYGAYFPTISYEHCGKLSPYNIYDALPAMDNAGILCKKITTRGGVMKSGELDFEEVRKFLIQIRKYHNVFVHEGIK